MVTIRWPQEFRAGNAESDLPRRRCDVPQTRRVAGQAERPVRTDLARHARRARPPRGVRPRRARRAARRPRRDSLRESAGVGHRRLRVPDDRRRGRADLSESAERPGRVHPPRLERRRHLRLERGAGGEGRRDPRRVSGGSSTSSRSPPTGAGADITLAAVEAKGATVDNDDASRRVPRPRDRRAARMISRRSSTRRARRASRRA